MRRYMLRLSYIGSSYRGAQKHCNNNVLDIDSIQGSIESALFKLLPYLKEYPKIVLAGRTDAGVHALNTAAHFDLKHISGETNFCTDNLLRMMNRYLISSGHEIRILSCQNVTDKFHARFSAKSRTYIYRFLLPKNEDEHRIPIAEFGRSFHIHLSSNYFNMEKLLRGIELFKGRRDFTTFSSERKSKKVYSDPPKFHLRTVDINFEESTPLMPFDPYSKNFTYWNLAFKSKSFLYNQVRRMTGGLFALGMSKISEDEFLTMLQVPSHNNWNPKVVPAQPHGLYLIDVEYDDADLQPPSE